jgi:uncharacterized SAM-binding protein YcdF (DUF218 family)
MIDYHLIQIAKELILPPGGLVLLALLGLLLHRRFLGKLLMLLTPVLLYLLSTPFAAAWLMAGLEHGLALPPETYQPHGAQAIVVLGGGIRPAAPEFGGDTVSALTLERIRYAVRLHRRTGLPVIASGGNPEQRSHSEAWLMGQVLREEYGVTPLALEEQSVSTWENGQYTGTLLQRLGIGKILLVTHAWHMPRALASFHRAGIETIPAPTAFAPRRAMAEEPSQWLPSFQAFRDCHYALREYLGDAWYRLRELMADPRADTPPRSPVPAAPPAGDVPDGSTPSAAAPEATTSDAEVAPAAETPPGR